MSVDNDQTVILQKGMMGNDLAVHQAAKKVEDLIRSAGLSGAKMAFQGKRRGSLAGDEVRLQSRTSGGVKLKVDAGNGKCHFLCIISVPGESAMGVWNCLAEVVPTRKQRLADELLPVAVSPEPVTSKPSAPEAESQSGPGSFSGITSRSEDVAVVVLAIDDYLQANDLEAIQGKDLAKILADLFGREVNLKSLGPIFRGLAGQGHLIRMEKGRQIFFRRPKAEISVTESEEQEARESAEPPTQSLFDRIKDLESKAESFVRLDEERQALILRASGLKKELAQVEQAVEEINRQIDTDGLSSAAARLTEIKRLL
ncbi:MAG: hypothetical protein WDZ85_03520 [Candidatus Paceibacterota bacterium]